MIPIYSCCIGQRLYFINQKMNCEEVHSPFHLLKVKNCLSRGFMRHSIFVRVKTKPISKLPHPSCQKDCDQHLFSFRKMSYESSYHFNQDICDTSFHFCPSVNSLMETIEGGAPHFTADKRIDTPCFAPIFQKFTQTDDQIFKDRFQKARNKADLLMEEKASEKEGPVSTRTLQSHFSQEKQNCPIRIQQLEMLLKYKKH